MPRFREEDTALELGSLLSNGDNRAENSKGQAEILNCLWWILWCSSHVLCPRPVYSAAGNRHTRVYHWEMPHLGLCPFPGGLWLITEDVEIQSPGPSASILNNSEGPTWF